MLSATSIALTASLSTMVASIYTVAYTFMMFGAPGLLIWAQRFKKYVILVATNRASFLIYSILLKIYSELRGTWDPAVPKVNVAKG